MPSITPRQESDNNESIPLLPRPVPVPVPPDGANRAPLTTTWSARTQKRACIGVQTAALVGTIVGLSFIQYKKEVSQWFMRCLCLLEALDVAAKVQPHLILSLQFARSQSGGRRSSLVSPPPQYSVR